MTPSGSYTDSDVSLKQSQVYRYKLCVLHWACQYCHYSYNYCTFSYCKLYLHLCKQMSCPVPFSYTLFFPIIVESGVTCYLLSFNSLFAIDFNLSLSHWLHFILTITCFQQMIYFTVLLLPLRVFSPKKLYLSIYPKLTIFCSNFPYFVDHSILYPIVYIAYGEGVSCRK